MIRKRFETFLFMRSRVNKPIFPRDSHGRGVISLKTCLTEGFTCHKATKSSYGEVLLFLEEAKTESTN